MANWTFLCYDDGNTPNLWQAWYDSNASAQGQHDATLDIIVQQEVWREPQAKTFDGLVEIRFKAGGVQHRIFGFYGEKKQQFIVLGIGYHKGKVYTPKDILNTCKKRKKEIEDDPSKAKKCARPKAPTVPE